MKKLRLFMLFSFMFLFSGYWLSAEAAAEDCACIAGCSSDYYDDYDYYSSYTGQTDARYFVVVAKHGAVVSYGEGKKAVETSPDKIKSDGDYYYFAIPSKIRTKGGSRTITAKLGENTTKLKVHLARAGSDNKTVIHRYKARYEANVEGYEYGRISVKESGKDIDIRQVEIYSNFFGEVSSDQTYSGFRRNPSSPEEWDAFLKPLVREGAEITIGRSYNNKYSYYYYKFTISKDRKNCEIGITKVKHNNKYKASKVKIPKQKDAPKVKINAIKETINTNNKMEFSFIPTANMAGSITWKPATKKMALSSLSDTGIASGGTLRVRNKATKKVISSKYVTINLPAQGKIDMDKITITGSATDAAITISDFDKTKKPYEYTTDTPSSSTKWKNIKSDTLTFKGKKRFSEGAGVKIYIREKAINENTKKKISLKLASSIMSISYTADGKWTKANFTN